MCSILLAALGADVVATDLSEGIKLLEYNIQENCEVITKNEGSVKAEILDWNDPYHKSFSFDVVIMIDVIYYLKVKFCIMLPLIHFSSHINNAENFCR